MHLRRTGVSLLSAAVLLTGLAACGGDGTEFEDGPDERAAPAGEPTAGESASPAPSAPAEEPAAEGVTVTIDLVDGEPSERLEPNVDVPEGDEVTLEVTSDTPQELHVHGYDEYLDVKPGKPAEVTFTADQAGSWEVEVHETGSLLFNLRVR